MGFSKSVNYLNELPFVFPTVRLHPLIVTLLKRDFNNSLNKMSKILLRCFGNIHEESEERNSQVAVHLSSESMHHDVVIDAVPALGQHPLLLPEDPGTGFGDFELPLKTDCNNNQLQQFHRVGSENSLTAQRGSQVMFSDFEDSQDFWDFEDVMDVMDDEDEDEDVAAASKVPVGNVSPDVSVKVGVGVVKTSAAHDEAVLEDKAARLIELGGMA